VLPRPLASRIGAMSVLPIPVVGPDVDVIGVQRETVAVLQVQGFHVLVRELHAPDPVEHDVLLGHQPMLALLVDLGPAQHLAAGAPVPDGHGPLDVVGDQGVVGDDHDGGSRFVDRFERLEDLPARALVQLARGLVGEQDAWPVGEGDGYRHTLLFATGQLGRPVLGPVAHPHQVEQLHGPAAPLTGGAPVDDHRQLDVLDRAQIGEEVPSRLLSHEADHAPAVAGPLTGSHAEEVETGHLDRAGRWGVQTAEHVEQCRLAASRGADDGHELAGLDGQVETLEGHDLEVGDLVDLDQAVADDDGSGARLAGAHRSPTRSTWPRSCRRFTSTKITAVAVSRASAATNRRARAGQSMVSGVARLPVNGARSIAGRIAIAVTAPATSPSATASVTPGTCSTRVIRVAWALVRPIVRR